MNPRSQVPPAPSRLRSTSRRLPVAAVAGFAAVVLLAACVPGSRQHAAGHASSTTTTLQRRAPRTANDTATTTVPPAPPTTAAPLPTSPPPTTAGVTLRAVDGGAGYFGRWANSFPTDPGFFPIGVWAETLANGSADVAQYKTIGVNTFTNIWNGPTTAQMNAIKSVSGMYAIGEPNDVALGSSFNSTYGNAHAAYTFTDEPDGNNICSQIDTAWLRAICTGTPDGRTSPTALANMTTAIHARDASRPVYGQFTKPVVLSGFGVSDTDRVKYVNSADIVSFDYYVLTDTYGMSLPVWGQVDNTARVRQLANYTKPVWPFVEITRVYPDSKYRPTPADVNAEVWNSIIGGARGIQYFNHDFSPTSSTQHALIDPQFSDIRAQVTATNALIKNLAPVINAPYADGYATTPTTLNTMVKAYNGSYYLFTSPRQKNTLTATIAVRSGTTAEVVNEGRNIPITGGTFTDTYTNQNTIHIYKITP